MEARTGYGGGYNERGIVEYRPRRDSDDDEYDEFGRVKKRKGKDSTPSNKVCFMNFNIYVVFFFF